MSTRSSIFLHHDPETDVKIHIYEECASGFLDDIRLEVEFPHGVTNVAWPREAFAEEMLQRYSAKRVNQVTLESPGDRMSVEPKQI
jgi:hypothetical protein